MSNKFLSGFIKMMNFNDVDDEDSYDDYYDDEPEQSAPKKSYSKKSSRRDRDDSSMRDRDAEEKSERSSSPFEAARKERAAKYGNNSSSKVVPYSKNIKLSEVCIRKPTSQKDAESICDTLLSGSPVVVNFCGVERNDRQRIMDFVCGCIYSIDGNMEIIKKEEMYIFSPTGIELSGDVSPDNDSIPTFEDNY